MIKISKGTIGVPVFKVSLFGDAGEIKSIGMERVHHGYGITEKEAIADFITENSPDVIDTTFKEIIIKTPKVKIEKPKNKLSRRHTKA